MREASASGFMAPICQVGQIWFSRAGALSFLRMAAFGTGTTATCSNGQRREKSSGGTRSPEIAPSMFAQWRCSTRRAGAGRLFGSARSRGAQGFRLMQCWTAAKNGCAPALWISKSGEAINDSARPSVRLFRGHCREATERRGDDAKSVASARV